jgi:hypothetical protein
MINVQKHESRRLWSWLIFDVRQIAKGQLRLQGEAAQFGSCRAMHHKLDRTFDWFSIKMIVSEQRLNGDYRFWKRKQGFKSD